MIVNDPEYSRSRSRGLVALALALALIGCRGSANDDSSTNDESQNNAPPAVERPATTGQVAELTGFAALREQFNKDQGKIRMLVLLEPG